MIRICTWFSFKVMEVVMDFGMIAFLGVVHPAVLAVILSGVGWAIARTWLYP